MVGGDERVADADDSHAVLQLNTEAKLSGEGGALLRRESVALFSSIHGLLAIDLTFPGDNLSGTTG
jgi:hypothetical protein